jgi:trehalose/maltose transport system permease protein
MTLIPPGSGRRHPSEQEVIAVELVSGLLMIIGLFAFAFLFYVIVTNGRIKEATQGPKIPGVGLNVELKQTQDGTSYFYLDPIPGGQADLTGVKAGDRLTAINGQDVTGWTLDQVRAALAEKNVSRKNDTFQIAINFLRPMPDGTLSQQERVIPKNEAPLLGVAFVEGFGLVVPIGVILMGLMLIRLGSRLRRYDIVAARWTLVVLLWLMMGLLVTVVWAFWTTGKGGIVGSHPFEYGKAFSNAIPILLAIIPLAVSYLWLDKVIDELFEGEETLTSRSTRLAWTLLIPTLVILLLVAARPLEQTFFKSLTDEEFSTNRPARYIGLQNYQTLLSFKITTVDCKKDPNGNCATTRNGSIVWLPSKTETEERAKVLEMTAAERKGYKRYDVAYTLQLPTTEKGLRVLGKDPIFLDSVGNTLHFTIVAVVLELLLGLVIALVVNSSFRGRGLMRTAMLVPWAIPTVVSAVLWRTLLLPDQTGIFNKLLMNLGILSKPMQWFAPNGPWMNSIIAVDVWKTAPFMALLLLAGLQVIPADLYEAAAVDGASKLRQFFSITLPLLRPAIAIALIFRTLDSLRVFDVFSVLLDTSRPSMATYNYNQLILTRADGYASAIGVIIFILIFIFTIVYVRFLGIEQE